ncbi:hypothetical protein D1007_40850 [Hordeum vulgare]|nr:hypothetical protein D1007_40850 [Hordeum vulgare]
MMRNNRIFQSLGIDAIASMIRKTNDVQEGTTNGVQEGSGVITDDPEYNPKEDEVVVHKTVKALKTASKKRKSSEASAAMPPGRVMAPPPEQTKRILEPDEPDRITRQKATMAAPTDHQESPVGMDFESSVEMRDIALGQYEMYLAPRKRRMNPSHGSMKRYRSCEAGSSSEPREVVPTEKVSQSPSKCKGKHSAVWPLKSQSMASVKAKEFWLARKIDPYVEPREPSMLNRPFWTRKQLSIYNDILKPRENLYVPHVKCIDV